MIPMLHWDSSKVVFRLCGWFGLLDIIILANGANEETVDFKDRETYEGLFKEYWDTIKEKEVLTLDDLHDADVQIKRVKMSGVRHLKPQYESDKSIELEENREPMLDDHKCDDHDSERAVKPVIRTNNKRPKKTPKRKKGSSRIYYWSLVEKYGSLHRKGPLMEKFLEKEVIPEEPKKIETVTKIVYSNFATIVPQNMKLVYLKRSLVKSLLENYETFESKVMGSFVKVKSEPVDPKYPYQLLAVTG
ncbi:uncharacterized protein LOC141646107 [Silene latifolia]|uniref:uncharacterized protein LOC141646107 n=1 Tax=Silene latifolia TaxID=37657 RepID=UPI003D76ED4C